MKNSISLEEFKLLPAGSGGKDSMLMAKCFRSSAAP